MASHLETTDVPLLYSPQYVTVRGRVTTVGPHVQSILSSEYWGGPTSSHGKNSARGLGQTLRPTLGPKDPTPPNIKWAIAYASTRNIVPSKKAIYRDGRNKCLWSRTYVVIPWSPIDTVNGTARL